MFTCERCGSDWCQQPPNPSELWSGHKCPLCGHVNIDKDLEQVLVSSILEEMDNEVS
jgi:hypothetical protein